MAVFHGFWRFSRLKHTIENPKIGQKNRFSQNHFYACSDGKYGFKTCLRHQEDSFHAKFHHFESFKGLLKNSNFCQKCDFLGFFEIFDLWVIFRFFVQNRSKIILNASKSFSGSPNTFQIHWKILCEDLKTIIPIFHPHLVIFAFKNRTVNSPPPNVCDFWNPITFESGFWDYRIFEACICGKI